MWARVQGFIRINKLKLQKCVIGLDIECRCRQEEMSCRPKDRLPIGGRINDAEYLARKYSGIIGNGVLADPSICD
jgi:hypothetical protein